MSPRQLRVLRVGLFLGVWLLLVVLAVMPARAQDGEGLPAAEGVKSTEVPPDDLNDVAVRLAPLLVGAALIERTIELLFNWAERAVLDVTHSLHGLAAKATGIVQVDLHEAWDDLQRVSAAMMRKEVEAVKANVGNPDSGDPDDWPLFVLEERLQVARQSLETAQTVVEKSLSSPVYVARKKIAAAWIAMIMGLALAAVSNLRVFAPLGVDVASWFDGPFDVLDLVLAGALMGLGTEWVHQLIGVIIQGKGLLGRVAQGSQLDVDQVRDMAMVAVQQAFTEQVSAVKADLAQGIDGVTRDVGAVRTRSVGSRESGSSDSRAEGFDVADHGYSGDADLPIFESSLGDFETELTGDVVVSDDTDPALDHLPTPEIWPAAGLGVAAALAGTRTSAPDVLPEQDMTAEPELLPGAEETPSEVDALLDDLADFLPLDDVTVRVRRGGANVLSELDPAGDKLGRASEDDSLAAQGLVWREQTWLQTPWDTPDVARFPAWVDGDDTNFARSSAYNRVVRAWYDAEPVLRFRRSLVRDILTVRKAPAEQLASVMTLDPADLLEMEESLAKYTMRPEYTSFWEKAKQLGLPDPFEQLPLQPIPPHFLLSLEINGFGPSQYAFDNWPVFYNETRGLHTGIDFPVREGTPLIAVADGLIVDFQPTAEGSGHSLALRPYLPLRYQDEAGARVLSNVIVVYGNLTGDPTSELVQPGDEVEAGQIIGTSGWPVFTRDDGSVGVQHNNAHLHLEVHLVTDGLDLLGNGTPFNPLLFWSPRLVAWQARLAMHGGGRPYPHEGQPYGRLGFFSIGAFHAIDPGENFWTYEPTVIAPWPPGVYPLDELLEELESWAPYPLDGSSAY